MFKKCTVIFRTIKQLLFCYPEDCYVRPEFFSVNTIKNLTVGKAKLLAVQSVPDKFYFLLLGEISAYLQSIADIRNELIVVRAVNGAVGVSLRAKLMRSALAAWLWSRPWIRAYGSFTSGIAYRSASWLYPVRDLLDWFRSKQLWRQLQCQGESLSLVVEGIELSDLLIDSYLRYRPSPVFDVHDPFVRRLIWQALRDIRQSQNYFRKRKPHLYLTSYTTYIEHGIAARVAVNAGVDVWAFGNLDNCGKRLTKLDCFHTHECARYRELFNTLADKEERLEEARRQLEIRLSGGIDIATSYMKKSAYGSYIEFDGDLNGAVVIFLHDFYDSPHIYPDMVFLDFWRWVCFTIETLQAMGVRFYLKPHPNQIALSDVALQKLRQQYPNLKWLPAEISNTQLAKAGIACGITVYGTVAHELAYLGVPSIGCASHPHKAFDFCRTARTRDEYAKMLSSYATFPIPQQEMKRQALAFYYMHNLYGGEVDRALHKAYVAFWRACNIPDYSGVGVLSAFRQLVASPGFRALVSRMAQEINMN